MFEGFFGIATFHALNFHFFFVTANTALGQAFWTSFEPMFRAWQAQQPFTVPLFVLENSTGTDLVHTVGQDAQTPPVIDGFNNGVTLVAWVYATQICGSVPLLSASFPSQTDHYYTIDPEEHATLLAIGWQDASVVAYVLPPA